MCWKKGRYVGVGWWALLADIAVESLKIQHLWRLGAKPLLSGLVEVSA